MADTIILDTNVLKHVSRGSQPIADALTRRLKAGDQVWIARASYNELVKGAPSQQMAGQYREMLNDLSAALGLLAARYVGNRPNPLCWNDPFPFQQGIEAIGCEVLERLNFPGRPADLQRLNLLCRP